MAGCIRVGDLGAARWLWGMMPGWGVVPDHVARLNMARLRSQGLHLGELRSMAESLVANTPPALPEDRAPAASLDQLKAWGAPTYSRAPPEQLGG